MFSSYSPFLLGLLWSIVGICCGLTEINKNKESNQVYSYTYHFQHNGTTDPKKFIERFLADTPSQGNIVQTFSNNDFRGFVSKGFLPSGPIGFSSYPNIDDIKQVVDKNFRELEKPLSPIVNKFPRVDLKVNNYLGGNGFPESFPHRQSHISRRPDGVVTRVQEFEKDIPNGKVYEKIETFSFNPPPNANVITHNQRSDDGSRHQQQVNQHSSRGFGHRTISYFTKTNPINYNHNSNPFNDNIQKINDVRPTHNNPEFGSRFTKPNDINTRQRRLPIITVPQYNNDNNQRRERFRDTKEAPVDNVAKKVDNILKNVNNRLNNVHDRFSSNTGFTWDDDNSDWAKFIHNNNNDKDWKRLSKTQNNWNNNQYSTTISDGPFGPQVEVKKLSPQSVDAIKSTLEALVGGKLDIPSFPLNRGNGNYGNGNGGLERIYHIDRIVEGPNIFSRNQHRGYERNFQINTNNGYQRSNQWSTNTLRRLDTQSSGDDFRRDFIDVFNDDK